MGATPAPDVLTQAAMNAAARAGYTPLVIDDDEPDLGTLVCLLTDAGQDADDAPLWLIGGLQPVPVTLNGPETDDAPLGAYAAGLGATVAYLRENPAPPREAD